jgi:DNA-binding transcriptional MerR regulator
VSEELMGIRAMCEAFDVTPRTLRFYEQKELLFPLREGQRRLYNRRDRARLKLILRGKKYGVSLEEIRQILDLYDHDGEGLQITKAIETARRRLAEMMEQRAALDAVINELAGHIADAEQTLGRAETQAA